jgi:hypothetical protein
MSKNCRDYRRFWNTTEYINQCFTQVVKSREDLKSLGLKSGYKKHDKFLKHLNGWMNLKADVPLAFLNAIGASTEEIFSKLEADKKEFEEYRNKNLSGAYGVVRIVAAMYNKVEIPEKYIESECINFVASRLKHKFHFVIHFGVVKSIWVEPSGKEKITYYDPDLKLGKDALLIKGGIPTVHYKDERMFDISEYFQVRS